MLPTALGAETALTAGGDFVSAELVARAQLSVRDTGCLLIERAFSRDWCAAITSWIDGYSGAGRTERHYGDSELRIWDAQRELPTLEAFWRQCNAFMSGLVEQRAEAHTLLAIRNRPIERGAKNLHIGRWHIDSFRRQYKIFLFLVDVAESTGPFEFLPYTQKAAFKLRMALTGRYFQLASLFGSRRVYQGLPDAWVDDLRGRGYASTPVICRAGTVMVVDTSAIHRASPCFGETRYALTAYF